MLRYDMSDTSPLMVEPTFLMLASHFLFTPFYPHGAETDMLSMLKTSISLMPDFNCLMAMNPNS